MFVYNVFFTFFQLMILSECYLMYVMLIFTVGSSIHVNACIRSYVTVQLVVACSI